MKPDRRPTAGSPTTWRCQNAPAAVEAEPSRVRRPSGSRARPMIQLSRRGFDLLAQVAGTNAEIAQQLAILPTTSKTHLQNTMRKLGARNRVETINTARSARLLPRADSKTRPSEPGVLAKTHAFVTATRGDVVLVDVQLEHRGDRPEGFGHHRHRTSTDRPSPCARDARCSLSVRGVPAPILALNVTSPSSMRASDIQVEITAAPGPGSRDPCPRSPWLRSRPL